MSVKTLRLALAVSGLLAFGGAAYAQTPWDGGPSHRSEFSDRSDHRDRVREEHRERELRAERREHELRAARAREWHGHDQYSHPMPGHDRVVRNDPYHTNDWRGHDYR